MGKKGHDMPKILRQELVLNIFENFAGTLGISTSEIHELLENKCPGVNRRTIYRDLDELSARFPIYDETLDGKTMWFLSNQNKETASNNLFREYIQKELIDYFKKDSEELTEAI